MKYKANKQTKSVNKTNSNKNKHIGMQNRAVVIRREATGKRENWVNGFNYVIIDRN